MAYIQGPICPNQHALHEFTISQYLPFLAKKLRKGRHQHPNKNVICDFTVKCYCRYDCNPTYFSKIPTLVTLSSGFLSLRTYQNFTGDDRGSLNCKCFLSFLRQISKPRYLQLNQNSNKMHHLGKLKSLVFVHFKSQY